MSEKFVWIFCQGFGTTRETTKPTMLRQKPPRLRVGITDRTRNVRYGNEDDRTKEYVSLLDVVRKG